MRAVVRRWVVSGWVDGNNGRGRWWEALNEMGEEVRCPVENPQTGKETCERVWGNNCAIQLPPTPFPRLGFGGGADVAAAVVDVVVRGPVGTGAPAAMRALQT